MHVRACHLQAEQRARRLIADAEQRAAEHHRQEVEDMEQRLHDKYEALLQTKVGSTSRLRIHDNVHAPLHPGVTTR